ncbi:MAG: accessory gene regulator B family protein [Lachnospiraceae bacterium]|nr:accessory gene regulator B family protein [Lachnospiraceae bacterium]
MIILPFTLIRKFAGGYHAGSTVRCLISSFFKHNVTNLFLLSGRVERTAINDWWRNQCDYM